MHRSNGVTFALRAYTIRCQHGVRADRFYIAPTSAFDGKPRWSKPYASLQGACAAVARRLAIEWRERDGRERAFYARKGRAR